MEEIQSLKTMINHSKKIVFLGGAGTSTESGIPDFRSKGGLYDQVECEYSPEQILSYDFFISHTKEFFDFYRKKILAYTDTALPNAAHKKLTQWEEEGVLLAIITQNIDGMHQAAGSKHVLELHGSINRNYCMKCGMQYSKFDILDQNGIPYCACGGIIKPDVILYGENLNSNILDEAIKNLKQADMLIVAGTSLIVYPAAGLINYFEGERFALVNQSATQYDSSVDLLIRGKIADLFSQL